MQFFYFSSYILFVVGLFRTTKPNEWYIIRRQQCRWAQTLAKLQRNNMQFLHKWNLEQKNLDIGNHFLKYERYLYWNGRSNTIRLSLGHNDSMISVENKNKLIIDIISQIIDADANNVDNNNERSSFLDKHLSLSQPSLLTKTI